jgi:hypothetical protein
VINLDLSWQQATAGAVGLAVASAALLRSGRLLAVDAGPADGRTRDEDLRRARTARRLAGTGGFVREAALVLGLFALWQLAGSLSVMGPDDAINRARWLWHAERMLHLPSEAALQRPILPHPVLVQASDLYYDILHFPVLIACLIWLFVRHRERYGQFRITLVAFTALCLLIQLIPVAPPRMLTGIGMVDTAAQYGLSVYSSSGGFEANQLSAMPSVHVGWAILVAVAVIGAIRSAWRWLAVLYPISIMLVVVVTANHFWLDGIAAAGVLAFVLGAQTAARRMMHARSGGSPPTESISRGTPGVEQATRVGGG